jgi:glycolate dehydrogenase FAD-binding subunit
MVAAPRFPTSSASDVVLRERDDSERLQAAVADAVARDEPVAICGRGSKHFLGAPSVGSMLGVIEHVGIIDYRPEELVLRARGGTPLAEIKRALAANAQVLPFDPPLYGGDGSLGGAVAVGTAGPARPWSGAVRDAVLGVTLLNGRAEVLRFGGQVMKNVAGFDVSRLVTGAFGTLGVLLDVSIKVLPRPQYEVTRAFEFDRSSALANVLAWSRTPLPLSGTCHVDGVLYVRLSGTVAGVRAAAGRIGGEAVHDDALWDALRDHTHPFFAARCWRLSVPPAAPYPDLDGSWLTEWGGAQRWLSGDVEAADVHAAARRLGGHAMPFFDAGPPNDCHPSVLKYMQRLKTAFDPRNIFNRGRLWPEN